MKHSFVLKITILSWLIIGWISIFLGVIFDNSILLIISMICFSTTTILTLCGDRNADQKTL